MVASKTKNKYLKFLLPILVLMLVFFAWYFFFNDKSKENDLDLVDTETKTTSTAPTAQEDFSDGNTREPGNSIREDEGSGIIEDTNGTAEPNNDPSTWTTSSSGEITVYSPIKNGSLKSGDVLSGTASTSSVSFRLIDNVTGVISQGQLEVMNGKFSGTFNFQTNATEGRLDIFNTRSDGQEFNNVEIPLKF